MNFVALDTFDTTGYVDSTIALSSAIDKSSNNILNLLTTTDSSLVHIGVDDSIFIEFAYQEVADSLWTQDYYIETSGLVIKDGNYNDSDTLKANVNVTSDDITIKDRGSSSAISGAFVHIDNGSTQESGFTDGSGVFNPTADLDYTYDIYVYKIGYRPLKVQHTNTAIYDNEIWYGDVQILGDVAVESGDTLTILAGTNVYVKPTSAVWNYANDLDDMTEILAYGGFIQVAGTQEDSVYFQPDSGGTGYYQWAGITAANGGSCIIEYSSFEKAVCAVYAENGPGRIEIYNTNLQDSVGIYTDFEDDSTDPVLIVESVVSNLGIYANYAGDGSAITNANIESEIAYPIYLENSRDTVLVEACTLSGDEYSLVALSSDLSIKNCLFKDADYNLAILTSNCIIDSSLIRGSTAGFGIGISYYSDVKMTNSTIDSCNIGVWVLVPSLYFCKFVLGSKMLL